MHELDGLTAEQADTALLDFLQERWKGVWPVLYGDQLRQARLDDWIFQGILDVEHLPS
jgi:glycerol-3-phosphate dehydrogenase